MATKKKVDDEVVTEEVKAEAIDPMEELVEVELFRDGGKYSGDVYVSVNGENCIVQRGVPVKIKRKFYEVIKQSIEQDQRTASEIAKMTK